MGSSRVKGMLGEGLTDSHHILCGTHMTQTWCWPHLLGCCTPSCRIHWVVKGHGERVPFRAHLVPEESAHTTTQPCWVDSRLQGAEGLLAAAFGTR